MLTVQRFIDRVLAGLPFTLVHLDDILVASPDRKTHLEHLRVVLERERIGPQPRQLRVFLL